MRHLRQRNIKIVSEIMNYLLKIGCKDVHIDYYINENIINFNFLCVIENLEKEFVDNMETLLSIPRRHDIEEYYWELTGDDDLDSELSLVGMMVDDATICYKNNKDLEIHLKRLK
ncbi:hypothetical protein [Clostridium sp.]|uniref:hypothetical protein n=1 Tax=Clostridium sp. TaxID=1506 RepID=UPI002FC9116E